MLTMIDTLRQLRQRGYVDEFSRQELKQFTREAFKNDYVIDQSYRIDELSDPEEQAAVYAISSKDGKRRGILINGYGPYSDPVINRLVEDTEIRH